MSDDQFGLLLGYLQRIEGKVEGLEAKVDKFSAELGQVLPRLSALEGDLAGYFVRSATAHSRIDRLDVRLGLIERRLELRDRP